jgi:hypothetical protein
MANLSTARKLSIVAKVAAQQAGRTRTLGAFLKASRITSTHVGRILHHLWLEVTGFVFLVLAVVGASALVREYHQYQVGQIGLNRVLVAAVFTAVFAWFGVSSFWRVRKKR